MSKKKIIWFARGGGIAKCGPFKSQIEAVDAMRLVRKTEQVMEVSYLRGKGNGRGRGKTKVCLVDKPVLGAEFPSDVFVWPEEAK